MMLLLVLIQIVFLNVVHAASITLSSYTQVPSTAAGPPVPTFPSYRVESFGDGAYMVTEGTYQGLFFVACESVIAVDAPPTIGEGMIRAIRDITNKPVSHVVYSHHHADHIGGAFVYGSPSNITYIAHRLTADQLALSNDYVNRPPPTITFEDSFTLRVCNQTLQLDYRGLNHDPGNIFIYAPLHKILMLVDIVYPGWIPFSFLGEAQNVPGYIRAHDQLLTYDFEHYIGGHLDRSGTRQDVLVARDYVNDLFTTCARAINMSAQANNDSSISLPSVIGPTIQHANPNNPWAFFATYLDALADFVTADLATRWSDKLYGIDVYGRTHAVTMLESVRIDFGILGPFGVINA